MAFIKLCPKPANLGAIFILFMICSIRIWRGNNTFHNIKKIIYQPHIHEEKKTLRKNCKQKNSKKDKKITLRST